MTLPPSDEHASYDPLGEDVADEVVAEMRDQSQLDFDLAFYGRVLERAPNYLDVLRCQGELLTRKGLHREALAIDRRLARLLPDDPIVRYNLACSLALNGQIDAGLAELRLALEQGYEDLDYLQADSDLDNLRDDPRYHALLRQFLSGVAGDEN
ncbi:MAG TPA: hypothetical protein VG713_22865 [Pirellulales bacterium]|jgi:tetratricopeptide (TPR) repeat protein|nr:hypothetical protein [Pirellulales bacterium]